MHTSRRRIRARRAAIGHIPHGHYYYHQQYLAKNPHGYCGLGGTGVSCPVGLDLDEPGD